MAYALSEPDSTTAQPAPHRDRPVQMIAAAALAVTLTILAVAGTVRLFPDPAADATMGDRAKQGHSHVRD